MTAKIYYRNPFKILFVVVDLIEDSVIKTFTRKEEADALVEHYTEGKLHVFRYECSNQLVDLNEDAPVK